jgi:putative membrane protein
MLNHSKKSIMKTILLTVAVSFGMLSLRSTAVSERDQGFAMFAAQTSMLEVKLGDLAQQKGVSSTVKTLGSHMVADHSKANKELKELATKKGIVIPTSLDAKHQEKYDKLAMKSGADFDRAYTKCMVKDHKKVVAKFDAEANKGDDSEMKAWAAKTKPTLEHHLHMSEEACASLKKDKESAKK